LIFLFFNSSASSFSASIQSSKAVRNDLIFSS